MNFQPILRVKVLLCIENNPHTVGYLAKHGRDIYFEYERDFIQQNLQISPIECPLKHGVQTFDPFLFDGLPGVFNDSLPDGWGRLLLDRWMRSQGVLPQTLSVLDRLTYVGHSGMGALVYEPDHAHDQTGDQINIERLAQQANCVLSGEATDVLAELLALNGSSAGARPKAMIGLHKNRQDVIHGTHKMYDGFEPWLVKFPNLTDGIDAGAIEYVYALMAKEAGLILPEVHLLFVQTGGGYFAVQRFDRKHNARLHTHTACGLLHSDFRIPALDYQDLIALTMTLTKDIHEVEKMYRLAVFNVMAYNRDDHGKNVSYVMDKTGKWILSPAYDLTFSSGPSGEQSTMVMGEGKNPGRNALVKLGLEAKLTKTRIDQIIEQTRSALSKWPTLAKMYGVSNANIKLIGSRIVTSGV